MDGEYLKSLLLHLRNRVHYPQFWAGRSRLAVSLSTLAWPTFDKGGHSGGNGASGAAQRDLARVREEVAWHLYHLALLDGLAEDEAQSLKDNPWINKADTSTVSRALLHLAEKEFQACRRAAGTFRILWNAFWRRDLRASLLQILRSDWQWLHPRRRHQASSIAIKIAKQRLNLLAQKDEAKDSLEKKQQRIWEKKQKRIWNRLGMKKYPAGRAEKMPWQAVYNAACLFALSSPSRKLTDKNVSNAIELLHRAVNYPSCDLEYPSEWIRIDPDLRPLHGEQKFCKFVRKLRKDDFEDSGGRGSTGRTGGPPRAVTISHGRRVS